MSEIWRWIILIALFFLAGFTMGNDFGRDRLYKSLSANVPRSVNGERIIQVITTIKFKDGVLVEIASFKELSK